MEGFQRLLGEAPIILRVQLVIDWSRGWKVVFFLSKSLLHLLCPQFLGEA